MGGTDRAALRAAALHLDRLRTHIDMEVNRRLGRSEPPPAVRSEIVRRFRTFSRLASLDWSAARPSFDGLSGNSAVALESTVRCAAEAARQYAGTESTLSGALAELEERFRASIRRAFAPHDDEEPSRKRRARKRRPNAGKRVRSAIDRIGDAYLALCLETGMVWDLNPRAETLFGGGAEDLLALEMTQLIAPASLQEFRDLESRLDAGEDSPPVAIKVRRLSGETIPVELTVATHTIGGRRLAIMSLRERTEQRVETYSTRTSSDAGIFATRAATAAST